MYVPRVVPLQHVLSISGLMPTCCGVYGEISVPSWRTRWNDARASFKKLFVTIDVQRSTADVLLRRSVSTRPGNSLNAAPLDSPVYWNGSLVNIYFI